MKFYSYLFGIFFLFTLAIPFSASAETIIYANNTDDVVTSSVNCEDPNSDCSIRDAIRYSGQVIASGRDTAVRIKLVSRTEGVYALDRVCDEAKNDAFQNYNCNDLNLAYNITLEGPSLQDPAIIDATRLEDRAIKINDEGRGNQVVTLVNLVIRNGNRDVGKGGAIAIVSSRANVGIYFSVLGNNGANQGGAIALVGQGTNLTIYGSKITGNSATDSGGGVYANNGKLIIASSSFTENEAQVAGAIKLEGSATKTVTNTTFTDNSPEDSQSTTALPTFQLRSFSSFGTK